MLIKKMTFGVTPFKVLCFLLFIFCASIAVAQPIKPGFTYRSTYNGKFYYISNNPMTWTNARDVCRSAGGNLVIINDAAENTFVYNLASDKHLWIGLTDEVTEGRWLWVDGSALSYSNWNWGQPDNGAGIENYVHMWANLGGKWNDLPNSVSSNDVYAVLELAPETYNLSLSEVYCGGGSTSWLSINMNQRRTCFDAMTIKVKFDTTKVRFSTTQSIQSGAALPAFGATVSPRVSRDTLFIVIDLLSGCIQGDSATNLLRIPFTVNQSFIQPNARGVFSAEIQEERIVPGRQNSFTNTEFQVAGVKVADIKVYRPNGVLVTGTTRPLSLQVGSSCTNMTNSLPIDVLNANVQPRIDTNRVFKIMRSPLPMVASPIVGGNDIYLIRQFSLGGVVPSPRQRIAADVNSDGEVSAIDVTIARKRSVGTYSSFYEYSAGRLSTDYQFVRRGNYTVSAVRACYDLPVVPTTCDTPKVEMTMVVLGDVDGDSDISELVGNAGQSQAKSGQNTVVLNFCNAMKVNDEWKIPIYANAATRSLDMHLRGLNISPNLLRVAAVNSAQLNVETNGSGVGQNFYIVSFASALNGIQAWDTLMYLYVKTPNLNRQDIGNIVAYHNGDSTRVQDYARGANCVSVTDISSLQFEVYPNPSYEGRVVLQTEIPLTDTKRLEIFDMLGQKVAQYSLAAGKHQYNFDISYLANGVYIFKVGGSHVKILKN